MKQILAVALLAALFFSCKKDKEEEDQSANGFYFQSIQQYDLNGNRLGNINNAVDDYVHEDWPDWVHAAFLPLDSADLTGYVMSEVSVDALYPNPCADSQVFQYFATQPVNLKLVIVDIHKNVYFRKSYHLPSAQHNFGLKLNYDSTGMMPNTYYRMFYAFSAENHPKFQRGHIDIYKQF